jgi:phage baseplate assembly protein W
MSIYKGFNTIGRDFGPYKLVDEALIVRDLLNSLYIRKGEKLMNPTFGTIIWSSLFEPLTPALKEAIRSDVQRMVNQEPRISALDSVVVQEYENGLRIDLQLTFSSTNQTTALSLQFDKQTQKLSVL